MKNNIGFYLAMYLTYWLTHSRDKKKTEREVGRSLDDMETTASKGFSIFFWVPSRTAGAEQIVYSLESFFESLEPCKYNVEISDRLPRREVDVLIAFKGIPLKIAKYNVLLLCDQAELFWNNLAMFDEVIVTSSAELVELLMIKHKRIVFVPEFEPPQNIECGRERLKSDDVERSRVFWHGGQYSFCELEPYIPVIESLVNDGHCDGLVIVSGEKAEMTYFLGKVSVLHLPWSYANLARASSECRLAILPARKKLKHSFLKPASRVRCAFSLGVYALGDARTPEVRRFASKVGAKTLTGNLRFDAEIIRSCWYDSRLMNTVEKAISEIEVNHSQGAIEGLWLEWFERTARKLQNERGALSSCGDI